MNLKQLKLENIRQAKQIKRLLKENTALETKVESAEKVRLMAITQLSENAKLSMDVLTNKELTPLSYEED